MKSGSYYVPDRAGRLYRNGVMDPAVAQTPDAVFGNDGLPQGLIFVDTLDQAWRTLRSLVLGYLSPKLLQGPVGMVQVMQYGWSVGVKEALFWMAIISLNLGILNLLPLPVLDGGHICFSLWEKVTKKPIKAKTMERLIIPFVVLLVILLIYITYQDLSRLFGSIL